MDPPDLEEEVVRSLVQQHRGRVICSPGAKLLYAFCESTVLKVEVVIRKSYGGGHWAMGGHNSDGTDIACRLTQKVGGKEMQMNRKPKSGW